MRGLLPFAWRSLAARRVRTLLTLVGIALGVAVLAAAVVTSDGMDAAIQATVVDVAGRADLSVTAFDQAGFAADATDRAGAIAGVATVAPVLERRTYPVPPVTGGSWADDPVAVLGIDPVVDASVRDLALVRGSPLARVDEPSVLVSETFAAASGLDVGSELDLYGSADAPADAGRFRIVGIVRGDGPVLGAGGRTVVMPIGRARTLFAVPGSTRLDLVLAPGADVATVTAALPAALAQPYVISTPADLASSLQASTVEFRALMALVAAIALFAGAFLIFNTLSMTVSERVREVGLLRAAGATRRQVTGVVLAGALVLGAGGVVLGLLLGLGLAVILGAIIGSTLGLRTDLAVPAGGLAVVAVLGLLVTLAAALEPALRAGRIPPAAALRLRAMPQLEGRARLRWLVVVALVVALAGVLLWPREDAVGLVRPLLVYGLLLVVALLTPFLLGPLGRIAGIPFGLVLRVEERLARGSLVRDRSRMALTVGALAVGLSLVVALATVSLESHRAASAWIEGVVPGDEVLTAVTPVALGSDGPIPDLAAVPGVARVSPIATFPVAYRGLRLDAAAVVGADMAADGRLTFTAGDRSTALAALDAGGAVVVPAAQADRLGLSVGSTMSVASAAGTPVDLKVVGIVERGFPARSGEALLVGWPDATGRFGVAGADVLAVRFQPGAASSAAPALDAAARTAALQPVPLDRIEGAVTDALGRVFGLFDLLALVAVVVAALGIVNTLTMDVVERVREIGILRAAGMTRRQVSRTVVVEAGILGLVGAAIGVVAGLVIGAAMTVLARGSVAVDLAVPWPAVGLAVLLGVGLAMLAAYYPARVAGRLSIVRAVRAE